MPNKNQPNLRNNRHRHGVGRPKRQRMIKCCPEFDIFKPAGKKLDSLDIVELTTEELEALRLKNIEKLDQNACAEVMQTSQSTFQRILASAYKKVSSALVAGKAIKIIK